MRLCLDLRSERYETVTQTEVCATRNPHVTQTLVCDAALLRLRSERYETVTQTEVCATCNPASALSSGPGYKHPAPPEQRQATLGAEPTRSV